MFMQGDAESEPLYAGENVPAAGGRVYAFVASVCVCVCVCLWVGGYVHFMLMFCRRCSNQQAQQERSLDVPAVNASRLGN